MEMEKRELFEDFRARIDEIVQHSDEVETLLTDYGFGDLDADGVDVEVSRVSEYSREEFE